MSVEVRPALVGEQPLLENLFEFYLHDLSDFAPMYPESDGRFASPGSMGVWWQRPALSPLLIEADSVVAGFALVCGPPHTTSGCDHRMNEFFVLRAFRRKGVGSRAAHQVFDRFPGLWEVGWLDVNHPAADFWRRAVDTYTREGWHSARVWESATESLPGLRFTSPASRGSEVDQPRSQPNPAL